MSSFLEWHRRFRLGHVHHGRCEEPWPASSCWDGAQLVMLAGQLDINASARTVPNGRVATSGEQRTRFMHPLPFGWFMRWRIAVRARVGGNSGSGAFPCCRSARAEASVSPMFDRGAALRNSRR